MDYKMSKWVSQKKNIRSVELDKECNYSWYDSDWESNNFASLFSKLWKKKKKKKKEKEYEVTKWHSP